MEEVHRKIIKIFVSSPSDVRPERGIAKRVIGRLAREFAYYLDVRAEMWEREPLVASRHFQEEIIPPRETDIVLVILWSELGVVLPVDKFPGALSGGPVTGTEWEFEDALAAAQVHQLPDLLLYRKVAAAEVKLGNRALVDQRQSETEAVEAFMQRWTHDARKSFVAAWWPFTDGASFEALVEDHLRGLLQKRLYAIGGDDILRRRWHRGSPYRGLETFEAEHEAIFFGRTQARNEIRELLARQIARGNAFVLVTGASGSGKSSLVRAGLIPDLCEAGMIGEVGLVRLAIVRPAALADPTAALAAALIAEGALPELTGEVLGYNASQLTDLLRTAPDQATLAIRQGLSAAGQSAELTAAGKARLLLIVDQLEEELFTMDGADAPKRQRFVRALAALSASGIVWVVATMRSDFLPRLDRAPTLSRLAAGEAKYFLARPDAMEIGQIVLQPAQEAGLRFERNESTGRSLADEILRVASFEGFSLPLLEYLLDQLWARRSADGLLTFADYHALGGLEGAIGARAEETIAALPENIRTVFPRVLRALTTIGQGAQAPVTARQADIAHFDPRGPERALIAALVDRNARLLVADGTTVRVAHEALLTHWVRARDQLAADRADLQLRARLEAAAALWQAAIASHRDSLLLANGLPLSEAVDLLQRRPGEFEQTTVAFVSTSVNRVDRAIRRRRNLIWAIATATTCLAIIFGGLAEYARRASVQSSQSFEAAAGALSTLIEFVPDKIEPATPLATVSALLDEAVRDIARLPRGAVETNPRIYDYRGAIALALADISYDLGKYTEMRVQALAARSDFEQALILDAANPAALAGRARAFHSIGVSYKELADDDNAALTAYERARAEFNSLLLSNPDAPAALRWRMQRADLFQDMGDLYLERFKMPDSAWTAFVQCLREREELARLVSDDQGHSGLDPAAIAHGIGWANNKLADVHSAHRDYDKALASFGQARDLIVGVGNPLQNNKHWQNRLSIVYNNIGLVLRKKGDLSKAIGAFESAVAVSSELLKRDPDNVFVKGVLGWSYDNSGETWYRLAKSEGIKGNAEKALGILGQARILREGVVHDALKPQWNRDLLYTKANIVVADGISAEITGDTLDAANHFDEAASISQSIAMGSLDDDHALRAAEFREWAAAAYTRAGQPSKAAEQLSLKREFVDLFRARLDQAKKATGVP